MKSKIFEDGDIEIRLTQDEATNIRNDLRRISDADIDALSATTDRFVDEIESVIEEDADPYEDDDDADWGDVEDDLDDDDDEDDEEISS